MRLTRQGVQDLGSSARPRRACPRSVTGLHYMQGPLVVIGYGEAPPPYSERVPIMGPSCLWCGHR